MITQFETETGPAFSAEYRGVDYYLRTDTLGRFELSSQRRALRAARTGGTVRHFATLTDVETEIAAFAGLSALMAVAA